MKVTFNLDYRTNWGEALYLLSDMPRLGGNKEENAIPMELDGEQHWSVTVDLPEKTRRFSYSYLVKTENGTVRREWGPRHTFFGRPELEEVLVYDRWQDMPLDKPYYASAFIECICQHNLRDEPIMFAPGKLTLRVSAPMLEPSESLGILGSIPAMGSWDHEQVVRMNNASFPEWNVSFDLKDIKTPVEYKFVIIDNNTGRLKAWEGGDNRRFEEMPGEGNQAVVMGGMRFINPLRPWKGAGVAIPVFGLRSEQDFGVGDFLDLKMMIDWAVKTGQKFIQVLPINDTTMTHTWTDSYPYNANSTFALHPMYLRVDAIGQLADENRRNYYRDLAHELNLLDKVDYERVNQAKTAYTREIFEQDGASTLSSPEFKNFVEKNTDWLKPYAAFCVLRDINKTPEFGQWGEYAVYDTEKIERFIAENQREIDFVYYQQYWLDRQLSEVRDYASRNGVALKGDIPIGISRTSVDAWISPRLFNLDCQAGAPPDDFSVLGQNWGFPTYNWEEMNKDGFAWWKARFRKMAEYFDAYRIDHVLGFFRIWEIPMDAVHGLLGHFNPALPFSPDELRGSYDFWLDVNLHTKPYIMDWFLGDFFGDYTEEAIREYLVPEGNGRYHLREEFNTQRKVVDYFKTIDKTDKTDKIQDALLGLIDQVLFIEDPVEKGKYHPRISAQFTYIYRSMNDYERYCFDRLYNDFYYRRHNDFWYGKAMWKLPPLLDATDMLVCAEDLGMIPACVPEVMNKLEILSLEIQRMPKDPAVEFGNTWSYPYYSVCTTSTHDMGGIRMWWEENRARTQRFYNEVLGEPGDAPQFAEPWICDRIVTLNLRSPSMLCILPMADILSIDGVLRRENPNDELINIPANPRHYWRYRMHLTLEKLLHSEEFNSYLRDKIHETRG